MNNELYGLLQEGDSKEEIEALKKAYSQCREENRRLKSENPDKTPYALGCLIILIIILIFFLAIKC